MRDWDYANHSHDVKIHGGVDGYNKFMRSQGAQKWTALLLMFSPLIVRGGVAFAQDIRHAVAKYKEKRNIKRLEAKDAEPEALPQKEKSQR